jgi:hypothetical protein
MNTGIVNLPAVRCHIYDLHSLGTLLMPSLRHGILTESFISVLQKDDAVESKCNISEVNVFGHNQGTLN